MECIPNRLTPLYSKIYYKEENYLKVRTVVFKYITPPYSKGWVCWCLIYQYILYSKYTTFLYSNFLHVPNSCHVLFMWLGYPLSYGSTGSISSVFYVLLLTQYKSFFSTCTILFIRSVIMLSIYLNIRTVSLATTPYFIIICLIRL